MKHVCKKPAKHLRLALEFLRDIGAEVAPVRQSRSLRLSWRYQGRAFSLSVALCRRARAMAEEIVEHVVQAMRKRGIVLPERAGAAA